MPAQGGATQLRVQWRRALSLLRFPSLSPPFYRDEHLFVSLRDRLVILDSRILTLSPLEYRLLALLVSTLERLRLDRFS